MLELASPVIFAALCWWLSTGLILFLISLPRNTYVWTVLSATAILCAGMIMVVKLRGATGVEAAYAGFATGLALWAWHEVMFLTGFITGSTRSACPENMSGFARFRAALRVVLHHEIIIAVHAAVILFLSWDAPNQFACWTFLILWAARICAKLVVFSGAPNIADQFLPGHLEYMKSYFSRQSPGGTFILAILLITGLCAWLAFKASGYNSGTFESAGFLLLTSITVLALIEHWALVLPWRDPSLWGWALGAVSDRNRQEETRISKKG